MGWRPMAWSSAWVVAAVVALALAGPALGAFPGQNGKIAFTEREDVWTMNADGSGAVNITNDGEAAASLDPKWSADGARIATWYAATPFSSIELMNLDGSGRVSVNQTSEADSYPDWSPDGTRLVFTWFEDLGGDSTGGISTMNANGTDVQNVGAGYSPVWSPDGTRIAFLRSGSADLCAGCYGIYTSNPDGTAVTELLVETGAANHLDWSPGGAKLLFQRGAGTDAEIATIGVEGTGITSVTNNALRDVDPAWSPDGTKIVFRSSRPEGNGIHIMNADGSNQTFVRFGETPDWQPLPGPRRADYKNQSAFCRAERDFLGDVRFQERYGNNSNGSNAFGKCVSGK
jgi:Tol biopolymer transport system component